MAQYLAYFYGDMDAQAAALVDDGGADSEVDALDILYASLPTRLKEKLHVKMLNSDGSTFKDSNGDKVYIYENPGRSEETITFIELTSSNLFNSAILITTRLGTGSTEEY